jgi:hypothetical protein
MSHIRKGFWEIKGSVAVMLRTRASVRYYKKRKKKHFPDQLG